MTKYNIKLEIGSDVYKASGETALDAINALDINYTQVKVKGVLTLTNGKRTSSKLFYVRPLRRIVCNKFRKVQVAKDLEYLLK